MAFTSIFNDILGPVMRGPSSSHTAGSYHIAKIARSMLADDILSAKFTFDPNGSYAPTYKVLGADKAFAIGLLGLSFKLLGARMTIVAAVGAFIFNTMETNFLGIGEFISIALEDIRHFGKVSFILLKQSALQMKNFFTLLFIFHDNS